MTRCGKAELSATVEPARDSASGSAWLSDTGRAAECAQLASQGVEMSLAEHYREWLRRLRLNEKTIRGKWGDKVFDDYDRYLSTCVRAFDIHYSSLAQFELKRID